MTRGYRDDDAIELARSIFHDCDNVSETARRTGIPRPTIQGWKSSGLFDIVHDRQRTVEYPFLHDPDLPVEELLDHAERRFNQRKLAADSREWMTFKMKDDKPFGLAFVGDPHLDDGGCNIPLFRAHHRLMAETDGVYPIGMGDFINNWSGKLAGLHKEQSITSREAFKIAEWLFSSLPWLLLIKGNHDMWSAQNGTGDPLDFMSRGQAPLEEWYARVVVQTPSSEFRIHARHDFKGHSQWNDLHALIKAIKMGDRADILAAGHRHIWGYARTEHNGHVATAIRARGYKFIDEYAERHQFESQSDGATILVVCHPKRNNADRVLVFTDLEAGCDYLKIVRKQAG